MFAKKFITALIAILLFTPCAFATYVDGSYTISGIQNNNIQLKCTCAGGSFTESPTQSNGSDGDVFSDAGLGGGITKAGCGAGPIFNLPKCQFQSTDATPIVYANVSITSLGYWCMGEGAPGGTCTKPGWAFAANWAVTPVSSIADYMVSSAPTASQPIPCKTGSVCNLWTGQLFKTIAGSVVVTGGPADLQIACTQSSAAFKSIPVKDDPQGATVDLQATHDQFSAGKPDQSVTALCKLTSAGKDYGSLTLQDINGTRVSTKKPTANIAHMWSTIVSIATQPDPTTNAGLNTPTFTTASDTSGNYHNLWSVSYQQAIYPGSLTLSGLPAGVTITTTCSAGTVLKTIQNKADPGTAVIDFQTISAQGSNCHLQGSNGLSYGAVAFTGLKQYPSQAHSGSQVWAANVSVTAAPSPSTGLTLPAPVVAKGSDSDPTGQFHNLWTGAYTPSSKNNKRG